MSSTSPTCVGHRYLDRLDAHVELDLHKISFSQDLTCAISADPRPSHEAPWRAVTAVRIVVAALAGAAVAVFAWLVLVPWDLSEVSGEGRMLDGGDDNAPQIALVAVAVVAIGLITIGRRATRADAPAFVAGGLAAWTALFAWRAGVSETSGANMFVVPLVMVFIPVAVVTPLVLRAVGSRLNRE
jgi:hypothetical protein